MNRVLVAVRLQLVAWPSSIGLAWMILGLAFAANVVVWGSIGLADMEGIWTGGLASIYFVFFSAYITSMTQVFPLAVGFGLTRREFYASMSVLAAAQSVVYGLVLVGLAVVERATGGWGVGLQFFRPDGIETGNIALQVSVYAVPFLFLAYVGICLGIVFKRWGTNGVYVLITASAGVAAAAVVIVTVGDGWDEIGRWLGRQSVVSLLVGWPLPVIAALAACGFAGIRRASP
jgi:hypothetical protein